MTATVQRENQALRLAHDGYSIRQILAETGLTRDQLDRLLRDFPTTQRTPCREERCGHPQDGPGRPRAGWIQIKVSSQPGTWFCTWTCVTRHAQQQERTT